MSSPLHDEFRRGYRPMDEPPGMEEGEYALWMKAGGRVDTDVPASWDGRRAFEAEENNGRRGMDPELRAIGAIIRILEDLEHGAESRVMVYLSDRFKARVP